MQHGYSEAVAHIGSHNQGIREDTWIDFFYQEDISPWLSCKSHLVKHYLKSDINTL